MWVCDGEFQNLQTTKASHVGTSLDSKLIIVKQNTRWQQSTIYIGTKLEMIYILESLVSYLNNILHHQKRILIMLLSVLLNASHWIPRKCLFFWMENAHCMWKVTPCQFKTDKRCNVLKDFINVFNMWVYHFKKSRLMMKDCRREKIDFYFVYFWHREA